MSVEVWSMIGVGIATLAAGLLLALQRVRSASGVDKLMVLGPVFGAAALAVFSAEHFTAAHELMPIVPRWLPYPLFWVYFVGAALLAAAISFISGRHMRWSAPLLAWLFLIIVATVDLPNMRQGAHSRFFWILTVRELSFAGGAMVLAGSAFPFASRAGDALKNVGRMIVALVMIFYGIEHFLYPRFVTGVPLAKPAPAWMPVLLPYFVGLSLVVAGSALLFRAKVRVAAGGCGLVLVLLTVFFYGAIFAGDIRAGRANPGLMVEDLNYIFDTMLFAGTVLMAGFSAERAVVSAAVEMHVLSREQNAV
jgi:uncharacterized membrane protein